MLSVQNEESVAVPLSNQPLSQPGSQQEPAIAIEDTAGSTEQSPKATQIHSKFAVAGATPLPADFHDTEATSFGQSLCNFEGDIANGAADCQRPSATDGAITTSHAQVHSLYVSPFLML